jgi:hypothetical protein
MNSYIGKIGRGFESLTMIELAYPGWLVSVQEDHYDHARVTWLYRIPIEDWSLRIIDNFSDYAERVCRRNGFHTQQRVPNMMKSKPLQVIELRWSAGVAPVANFFNDIHRMIVPHGFDYSDALGRTYGELYLEKVASLLEQWGYRNTKQLPRRRSVEKAIKRGMFTSTGTKLGG